MFLQKKPYFCGKTLGFLQKSTFILKNLQKNSFKIIKQ